MASGGSSLDLDGSSLSSGSSAMARYAKLRGLGVSGDRPARDDSTALTKVNCCLYSVCACGSILNI